MAVSLDLVLNLAETVIQMGQNSKQNKDRCQRVTKRVRALQELVIKLKEKDPAQISKLVSNALKELSVTLISAQNIMKKYKKSNAAKNFIKHSSYEEKFNKIDLNLGLCCPQSKCVHLCSPFCLQIKDNIIENLTLPGAWGNAMLTCIFNQNQNNITQLDRDYVIYSDTNRSNRGKRSWVFFSDGPPQSTSHLIKSS